MRKKRRTIYEKSKGKDSLTIYSGNKVEKLLENGEIAPEEAAFMRGYLEEGKKDEKKIKG
jgi:hypothetical protein